MAPTKEQLKSGFSLIVAVTETIREAREIPAGTLYAVLMARGCGLETFNKLIGIVTGSGLVEKRGDLLRWVGPEVVA